MKWLNPLPFFLLALTACAESDNKEESPQPQPPADEITLTGDCSTGKLVFSSDGTVSKLSFKTSDTWTISVPDVASSWCTVDPLTGAAGAASPSITVSPNASYDERNASLTITSGTATATIVVTQKQKDAILISSSKVEVSEAGETFAVKVQANVPVSTEIPAQYSWLHKAAGSRALTESEFSFTADPNDSENTRQAQIIFKGNGIEETVNVYQSVYNGIILTETTKHIGSEGGRFAVELRSNVDFTYAIAEDCNWLHEDKSRAFSSHTIYFVADPYEDTTENRSTTITFTPPHC